MNNNHVFDTNTLVSTVIFPNSVPDKALQKAEREGDLVRCKIIITGDSDLLVLHPYHGISILKAAEFLFTQ